MACRDCCWFEKDINTESDLTVWGECKFAIPVSAPYKEPMMDVDGKGCPQFKERTDGD